jgi:dolichol-phosphate mannosyltransferase
MNISIILPCYNERENILALCEAIANEMLLYDYQIVIVDDNSPDGTFQLILDANIPNVVALQRTHSPSLAESIRYGIDKSDGDIVVVMDSDFNHQTKYLPIMVDNIKYYDCVSASRFVYGGNMNNFFRHVSSWLFNIFSRVLTQTFVTDSLFGFFAVKREVLNQIDFDKVFWGYGDYCIRLMYYLQKRQVSILQIPAVLGERLGGQGNSQLFSTLLQYTVEVLQLSFINFFEKFKK